MNDRTHFGGNRISIHS